MWLDTFNQMRKESGMSLDELCEKSGVPKGTLTKITSGVTKAPALETMRSLVYAMGYTLNDLSEGIKVGEKFSKAEKDHIRKYRSLDSYGKEAVEKILDIESKRCSETGNKKLEGQKNDNKVLRFRVPEYMRRMSAGTGQEADLEFPEDLELTKAPPRGTSYVARVSGDSMEPTYSSGDLIFVHSCEEIPVGRVGVFLMDGQQWVKELGDGVLISHNPAYPPRSIAEGARCQGLVLGICDGSYFE